MSTSCQHDITHVICVSGPFPFFATVPQTCFILMHTEEQKWGMRLLCTKVYIHKSRLVLTTVNWEKVGVKIFSLF